MLRKSILFVWLSLFLITQSSLAKDFVDDKEATAQYSQGLSYFQNNDFVKSFDIFEVLVTQYPQHKLINFYYGRSAFELKKYEFALTSFDRILILEPTNHRVRLEYARTLLMMKSYQEAKKEFNAVLSSPIPTTVRENIEKFLQIIEREEKGYYLSGVAIFGIGWDNNINNNTYESITLVNSLPLNNDTNKQSDTNFKAIVAGNLIVPSKSNNAISWETTGIVYMQEQRHYHDNDIFITSLASGVGYTNQKYKNLTSATYDHIWIGGDQAIYIYGIANNFKYNIYSNHLLGFDLKYKKKKMKKQLEQDKNADMKEFGINYTLPLQDKQSFLFATTYLGERKTNGTRIDISKDTNRYKISYIKNFLEVYDATIGYQIDKTKYLDIGTMLPKRDDEIKYLSLNLSKKLNKTQSVSIELNDTDAQSNINAYTYKKRSANLNFTVAF